MLSPCLDRSGPPPGFQRTLLEPPRLSNGTQLIEQSNECQGRGAIHALFLCPGSGIWRISVHMVTWPTYDIETSIYGLVAGVDEVGRGPLAGPVMAAAVILNPDDIPDGLNDSKRLSAKARNALAAEIEKRAWVGVGEASVDEIDVLNILRASHVAMCRALENLPVQPNHVLIDGNLIPADLSLPATALVKGDTRSLSISAASIVAKTRRDALMVDLAQQHPGYGWETNMGYPSKSHKAALQDLGVTPHHRRSFKPVHNILYQEKLLSD